MESEDDDSDDGSDDAEDDDDDEDEEEEEIVPLADNIVDNVPKTLYLENNTSTNYFQSYILNDDDNNMINNGMILDTDSIASDNAPLKHIMNQLRNPSPITTSGSKTTTSTNISTADKPKNK
jgi:hypothetical protein